MTPARRSGTALAGTSLLALFGWLMVGDLGIAIRERAALPSVLELLRRHDASDTVTSLLVSTVPALLSLMLVPLIGYHSDRFQSRWGRRRPFLMALAPLGAAAMIGLALSPALGALTHGALGALSPGLRICNLAYFCLFWTGFECAAIGVSALFAGLVSDMVPAGLLGRFYAGVRMVGLGVGIGFNSLVFALTEHYLFPILAALALLFSVPVVLMCAMLGEPQTTTGQPRMRAGRMPRAQILDCLTQRSTLWIFAAFALAGITFSPFNTFCQYYAQVSGLSKAELGTLTAWGYAFSMLSAFGVGALVDRHGPVRVSTILMAAYLLAAAAGYAWLRDGATFRLFYGAHIVISGAYFTAAASMPMALFPNAQFVQYNATKDLLVGLAGIVLSSVQGPLLDHAGHDYRLTLFSAVACSALCVACLLKIQFKTPVSIAVP